MRKGSRAAIVFACCVLAMPTCVYLLNGFHTDTMLTAVVMGVVLGVVHLAVRPIVRLLSAPIGCMTLGFINPLLDVVLIYACAQIVEGFEVTNPLHALLAAILINVLCFIGGGRR